jgi:hypothetical protein
MYNAKDKNVTFLQRTEHPDLINKSDHDRILYFNLHTALQLLL